MSEAGEQAARLNKKQKTVLIVLAMVAMCLILTIVTVFWILPKVMRSHFKLEYVDLIQRYSKEYDLEPSFVAGVIYTESKFRAHAHSGADARGLMQVIPETGEQIAKELGEPFDAVNLYDPETSIRYGCYYLRKMLDRFDRNPAVALAAYNAGPNKAAEWLREYGLDSKGRIAYIPYPETSDYVKRVFQAQENYENLYKSELRKTED